MGNPERRISRALISVSDKTGVVDLACGLAELGVEIISTGGTAKALADAGITVIAVSDLTHFPEMLDGRVKTLHPIVHGAVLARRDKPDHMRAIEEAGIDPIDLVVVNLYPFAQTIAKPNVTLEDAVENIDIGGPAMVRSAAKNFDAVTVIVDPEDYDEVLDEIRRSGGATILATRQRLMVKAFGHTSTYDRMVYGFFETMFKTPPT